jgi:uncharacterized protein YndB with AHSA1/START domain
MSNTTEIASIEREIEIAASPETIWRFLVDPRKAVRWMGLTASLDPRPGGVCRFEVVPGSVAAGEFVEVDEPRRLVYTFGWEREDDGPNRVPTGSTTVAIELVPHVGGTTLRLIHSGLPTAESASGHGHGWDHYLERLAVAARGDDPGVDPWTTSDER